MDLLQNPFHILTASPRDNGRRIMELADERSLLLDSRKCIEARSDLTNPRKRLSAEVAWLPGIGPKRATEALSLLESSPTDLLAVDKLSPIARANLLAAGLARLADHNVDDVAKWALEISWAFEDIDPEKLSLIINEERVVSGFPKVSDLSAVEAEIQERRRYYCKVIKSALNNLSAKELVEAVTVAVESATDDGEEHGPILIADLVDSYEVEAQGFFDKEEGNIRALIEKLRGDVHAKRPDSVLAPTVIQLIQVVKNWDTVAQPIQVSAKSRGINHDASHRVAGLVRGLAIHMFNEHSKLHFSQQLTNMLQEVFVEVREVAERTAEDVVVLENMAEQRTQFIEQENKRIKEWEDAISINIDLGTILEKRFKISPDGIEWKKTLIPLEKITKIRWWTKRKTQYGKITDKCTVAYGNKQRTFSVVLVHEGLFSKIVGVLWRAVGVRLLTEYIEGLREGKSYHFGHAIINDYGMELARIKFLGSNERVFCPWNELEIWDGPGTFCVGKKEDGTFSEAFSYQYQDNIHVLESAIRMFWKRGGDRLSSLLGE